MADKFNGGERVRATTVAHSDRGLGCTCGVCATGTVICTWPAHTGKRPRVRVSFPLLNPIEFDEDELELA